MPRLGSMSLKISIVMLIAVSAIPSIIAPLGADELHVVRVLAAGSLRMAMNELGTAFSGATNIPVQSGFGPSGVLRERIDNGEPVDLFASADMGNPLTLARAGKAGPVILFARNRLCALVRPGLQVSPDTVLSTMLSPDIKLGTSTPKADPAGDYTWAMFAKAEAVRPGSRAQLEARALQLTGGPNSASAPAAMDIYAWHLREGHADIFVSYCSAGTGFGEALPGATVVNLPPELATGADYGLTLLPTDNENAAKFALFILSQDGQAILARNGFAAPLLLSERR